MLIKNFFRDLAGVTSRLISVIVITIVAVMVYVGLNGIAYNGEKITEDYFNKQNTADLWISGMSFDKSDFNEVLSLQGINKGEERLIFEAASADNDDIKLALYGISRESSINKPYIVRGNAIQNNDEIMISSEFAKKQGLDIGDEYSVKIAGSPKKMSFKICALIKSPERMYNISQTVPSPDYSKYGFAYVDESALSNILGKEKYNQIVLTLDKDADIGKIKSDIIDKLDNRVISVTELKDNVTANNLTDFINGIKPITQGVPLIFFVIAALLMVSTMTRIIDNSRGTIGTLKALGYSNIKILLYYFSYSVIVSVFGFIIGAILSKFVITKPISGVLFALNDLPDYTIMYDKSAVIRAFIFIVIACMGTSLIITGKELRESPAQCMRPKAPKKESRLLIEKVPFIWRKLSFSKKYIAKNTFRNRWRALTCIIGISACMALILTCLSLKDSINNFTDNITNNQHRYDIYASLNPKSKDYDIDKIDNNVSVNDTQYVMNTTVVLSKDDKNTTDTAVIVDGNADLKLTDIYDSRMSLPSDGIIISKDTADRYNIKSSDYIDIKFIGSNTFSRVKVSEVNSSIKGICTSRSYAEDNGAKFAANAVYIKTSDSKSVEKSLAEYDFVSDYKKKDTITNAIINKISVLSLVVYVLIVMGGILAVVVLYNLGIMSFHEQIRNLATLKVLGFYPKEIKKLQLTENIIFTVIGIILGIPLGRQLTKIITGALTLAELKPVTNAASILIGALLTIIFANIVNKLIGSKMKSIDMLGSLKSIE